VLDRTPADGFAESLARRLTALALGAQREAGIHVSELLGDVDGIIAARCPEARVSAPQPGEITLPQLSLSDHLAIEQDLGRGQTHPR
jgi:hypothetical protein